MNIAVAQIEVVPGRPDINFQTMKEYIIEITLACESTNLIVFPELSIPGYLIGDMWEEKSFIDDCEYYGKKVAELAKECRINIAFGNVACIDNTYTDGRPLKYNALFIANMNGEFITTSKLQSHGLDFISKTLLPNYREFDEPRHFSDIQKLATQRQRFNVGGTYRSFNLFPTINNNPFTPEDFIEPIAIRCRNNEVIKVGFTLCEDGWDGDYPVKPIKTLCDKGAQIIINHSCSPFTVGKNGKRNRVFGAHARDNKVPVIYVNAIGSQNNGKTIYTFDGCSVVYNSDGHAKYQLPSFEDNFFVIQYDAKVNDVVYAKVNNGRNDGDIRTESIRVDLRDIKAVHDKSEIQEIYESLVYGIRTYMAQCGLTKVVIGSSGGIDSAVAAALYSKVLSPENVLLVNMPSKYNSATTKGLSAQLATNIGCYYTTIPIGDSVELTKNQIDGLQLHSSNSLLNNTVLNLSEFDFENVQARDRSSRILAACASAFGGVFTNNGNKAETAVGYCTLYGDHAGFLAALADLWKGQVYLLGKYINYISDAPVIPEGIFNIPASAELSEAQSIEGDGDPLTYWYHDKLFRCWIEDWHRKSPFEVLEWYRDGVINERLDIEKNQFGIRQNVYELFPTTTQFCDDLERWWKLFKGMGTAKRVQAPPVLAVSKRAFGFDYRECLNGIYFTRKYIDLKDTLVNK